MGIYLFRLESLYDMLREQPQATDLVTESVAGDLGGRHVQRPPVRRLLAGPGEHRFLPRRRAWPWPAKIPPFEFPGVEGAMYTHMRDLPASRVGERPWSTAWSATAA